MKRWLTSTVPVPQWLFLLFIALYLISDIAEGNWVGLLFIAAGYVVGYFGGYLVMWLYYRRKRAAAAR